MHEITGQLPSRSLVAIGLNYRSAPLALRERLAIPACELTEALRTLRRAANLREAVILSTCNRLEIYGVCSHALSSQQAIADFLSFQARLPIEAFQDKLYRLSNDEAAAHLFHVTAGLDSMIFGESEITTQVKNAYQTAQAEGATGPILNRLFQKALHGAKIIRSQTHVAEGNASIGSVVTALAKHSFGERLHECSVLLWGAGKAAEATARHLTKQGVGELWVINRTATKAQALAASCRGGWLSWEKALQCMARADIAIICTQAPHYVFDQADLAALLPQRSGRPLILVDLAVPRNVDPAVAKQPGVRLYDIDTLQSIAQITMAKRRQEIERCEALIGEQVEHFNRWLSGVLSREEAGCQESELLSAM